MGHGGGTPGVELIAEPWDVGEGGYQVGNFPTLWTEWNGKYRDTVRDWWRWCGAPKSPHSPRYTEGTYAASRPPALSRHARVRSVFRGHAGGIDIRLDGLTVVVQQVAGARLARVVQVDAGGRAAKHDFDIAADAGVGHEQVPAPHF